jgi:sec-independent protein translocase protein TatB
MGNFSLSEIVTIVVIILIVFGPDRLPEMAKKAGQLVSKGRTMINDLRQEFESEWGDVAQPLKDVRQELMGAKADMESSMASLNEEIARAKRELEKQVDDAKEQLEAQLGDTAKEPNEPGSEDDGGEPGGNGETGRGDDEEDGE